MVSRLSVTQLKSSPAVSNSVVLRHKELCRFGYFPRNSCSEQGLRFKVVGQSLGDRWKLKDIDTHAVQERLYSWLSKTQNFFSETLVKTGQSGKRVPEHAFDAQDMEDIFMAEQTIDGRTPNGNLSLAAIVSIEQFSRCNYLV
ncbi:hypothetical protein WN944_006465 [Citrus x changshan-huyou]|uniref:Uncharacterized protein n=1 Tax=Citrus x changshan-huyou TaxID=2935761 RepID=A0AAP0MJ81_9ROSI